MELRLRDRARTTKDLDLSCRPLESRAGAGADPKAADPAFLESLREALQDAAARDLGDYLAYRIGPASTEIEAAPEGGARFPVVVALAGREYGRFHVDVGVGSPSTAPPERLVGDDLLGFAGIAPAVMLLVPREMQFAEKLHAYTHPWDDRENTRTKDLVDLLLLIDLGLADREALRRALAQSFADRSDRAPPRTLPPPPESWRDSFAALAAEVGLDQTDLDAAFGRLHRFWESVR